MFPSTRLSRLRKSTSLQNIINETNIRPDNFIYPIFVEEELNDNLAIQSMPGQYRIAEKNLTSHIKELYNKGIKAVILFGISHHKDERASDSLTDKSTLARIINKAKNAVPEMLIISDNCFCEYTNHGHCGYLKNGYIDNDLSLELLAKQAVICAEAGADMVAPSAMLDGQVLAIRQGLDRANYSDIPIMSYAIKFASSFYGPFREAANSKIAATNIYTDRKTYQMQIGNLREALQEAKEDELEGADILMVKPAGLYLDVISNLRNNTHLPIAAYQVSGEYSAIKFASLNGAIDENAAIIESLTSIKRAGANIIISYFTPQIIELIN